MAVRLPPFLLPLATHITLFAQICLRLQWVSAKVLPRHTNMRGIIAAFMLGAVTGVVVCACLHPTFHL